ncbi:hypothetical protein CUC62_20200, partial [Acinetobacter baumannii]
VSTRKKKIFLKVLKMAKESQEHKLLKYNIENSLKVDKDFVSTRKKKIFLKVLKMAKESQEHKLLKYNIENS